MRDQFLYFNHLTCFLSVVLALPTEKETGDEIEDGVQGQGVSGHATWQCSTLPYITNWRRNLY